MTVVLSLAELTACCCTNKVRIDESAGDPTDVARRPSTTDDVSRWVAAGENLQQPTKNTDTSIDLARRLVSGQKIIL